MAEAEDGQRLLLRGQSQVEILFDAAGSAKQWLKQRGPGHEDDQARDLARNGSICGANSEGSLFFVSPIALSKETRQKHYEESSVGRNLKAIVKNQKTSGKQAEDRSVRCRMNGMGWVGLGASHRQDKHASRKRDTTRQKIQYSFGPASAAPSFNLTRLVGHGLPHLVDKPQAGIIQAPPSRRVLDESFVPPVAQRLSISTGSSSSSADGRCRARVELHTEHTDLLLSSAFPSEAQIQSSGAREPSVQPNGAGAMRVTGSAAATILHYDKCKYSAAAKSQMPRGVLSACSISHVISWSALAPTVIGLPLAKPWPLIVSTLRRLCGA
ncbi:hypothetical protein K461DRAFT_299416 [Myriangium duriaei CBS 260.36]|uniref:Uncharacterized protein n=1 Tax=Myriangium duriaei CBS 260.36 TaxID=1168546 RepID=A0A9P4MLP4_9PEZI|nr:hypothetical protein K461DRAFT_299416 [Myriangium duriaei CBS 260.36]